MSDAARLEAIGAEEAPFSFRGQRLVVVLDIEKWPAWLIRGGYQVAAVEMLLGAQDHGLGPDPVLDDYRELSDAMAAAVGVSRLPEQPAAPDQWFGAVPTLLRFLEDYEDDVASDLKRFWGVRYADRFTGDLTLREIWTYLRRSESTSCIARANNGGMHVWTEPDFIGAGIYQALTGEIYPGRPLKPEEVERAIEAMRADAQRVATLRERQAEYAPTPPAPAVSALSEAETNRRRELGLLEDGE